MNETIAASVVAILVLACNGCSGPASRSTTASSSASETTTKTTDAAPLTIAANTPARLRELVVLADVLQQKVRAPVADVDDKLRQSATESRAQLFLARV